MRVLLAIATVVAISWMAWLVGRVDASVGAPLGPDRLLANADPESLPKVAAAKARRVLHDNPINGHAYRVLAQVAQATGDTVDANRLYAAAVRRWPRERAALAALAEQAFLAGDPATGLTHLDALLRVAPETRSPVLTALLPAMSESDFRVAMVERLRQNPPWRSELVAPLLADTTPAEAALALLADLARVDVLRKSELHAKVSLLDRQGRPAEARRAWLDSLTPEQRDSAGLLFDGSFEHPDISGGYGWSYRTPPGVAMGPDDSDSLQGERSMAILFDGRAVSFDTLEQPLVLSPGHYRLEAAAENAVASTRPFVWRIACSGEDGRLLLQLALEEGNGWQVVEDGFDVPVGCPRQHLKLRHTARSLAERQPRGVLRLDGMSITKVM